MNRLEAQFGAHVEIVGQKAVYFAHELTCSFAHDSTRQRQTSPFHTHAPVRENMRMPAVSHFRDFSEETDAPVCQIGRPVLSVKVDNVFESFEHVKRRGQPTGIDTKIYVQLRVSGLEPVREDEKQKRQPLLCFADVSVPHFPESVPVIAEVNEHGVIQMTLSLEPSEKVQVRFVGGSGIVDVVVGEPGDEGEAEVRLSLELPREVGQVVEKHLRLQHVGHAVVVVVPHAGVLLHGQGQGSVVVVARGVAKPFLLEHEDGDLGGVLGVESAVAGPGEVLPDETVVVEGNVLHGLVPGKLLREAPGQHRHNVHERVVRHLVVAQHLHGVQLVQEEAPSLRHLTHEVQPGDRVHADHLNIEQLLGVDAFEVVPQLEVTAPLHVFLGQDEGVERGGDDAIGAAVAIDSDELVLHFYIRVEPLAQAAVGESEVAAKTVSRNALIAAVAEVSLQLLFDVGSVDSQNRSVHIGNGRSSQAADSPRASHAVHDGRVKGVKVGNLASRRVH